MATDPLPLATRLWFAWMCFFQMLFDGAFASRVWGVRHGPLVTPPPPAAPPVLVAAPTVSALQLLSLLQREGRLIDFVQQDIAAFPDADIGAVARVVHEGCRRALRAHVAIEPVRSESEGARVTLGSGFRADEVKLVGDVKGQPPYAGVLRHKGLRARQMELPQLVGDHDAAILAPAEVELG